MCCLSACQKGNGNSNSIAGNPQTLILGKWNLMQQKFTQYINNVKQTDTLVAASANDAGYAQFNINGTYVSESHYFVSNGNGGLTGGNTTIAGRDSVAGTYNFSGTSFNLSSFLAGLNVSSAISTLTGSASVPVITPVSHFAQINQLNSNTLTIHLEFVVTYTYTATGIVNTVKTVSDLYYMR